MTKSDCNVKSISGVPWLINTQSDSMLKRSLDQLNVGLAVFSEEGRLCFCNQQFKKHFSRLRTFLEPGLEWNLLCIEVKLHYGIRLMDELNEHLDAGLTTRLDIEAERGEGVFMTSVQTAADGSFTIQDQDISELVNARQSGSDAERLLADVMDGTTAKIAMIDPDNGQILYNTPAWSQTFLPVSRVADIFSDSIAFTDLLTDVLSSGFEEEVDVKLQRRNEEIFPARVSARLIDYLGSDALIISVDDLTRQYRQQQELLQSRRRLFDAIEALDQGFALFDANSRLVVCNEPFQSLARAMVSEVQPGIENHQLVSAAEAKGLVPDLFGLPEGSVVDYQFEVRHCDGRTFRGSRRGTKDGGLILAWRDISHQVATEKELEQQREAAFQNEKLSAMGQLLAGVAHELNNPLSIVLGHAMMLQEDLAGTESSDSIDRISRAAERCAKIVRTFLAMARQSPAKMTEIFVNDIIELAVEITLPGLRKSGVKIETRLTDLAPVKADENQLTQVIINLVLNAAQAKTEASPSLLVQISSFADVVRNQIVIRVSDDGPGIPEHVGNRVFEPFFTTKEVGDGTGLGLSLCHRMIESHGGSLTLAGSELGGASFDIRLPAVTSDIQP